MGKAIRFEFSYGEIQFKRQNNRGLFVFSGIKSLLRRGKGALALSTHMAEALSAQVLSISEHLSASHKGIKIPLCP